MHRRKKAKIITAILLTPVILVLLVSVLLYLPPFQRWAVAKACDYVSAETGMDVGIDRVRLSFPLDLSLQGVHCMKPGASAEPDRRNSQPNVTDTIACVEEVVLDVELLPLFSGDIHVQATRLSQAKLNTADLIHTVRIKGVVGELNIVNESNEAFGKADTRQNEETRPVASILLDSSLIQLGSIALNDAHLNIELSDTVPPDTTESENLWKIFVHQLAIHRSSVTLHMPGDTLQMGATLTAVKANEGFFDLGKGQYDIAHVDANELAFSYDNNFEPHLKSGLDAHHIALSDIHFDVDSIHYLSTKDLAQSTKPMTQTELSCRIRKLSLREQSGLTLRSLRAAVKIDPSQLSVDAALATPASTLALNVNMQPNGIDSLSLDRGSLDATMEASIGRQDLMTFAFANMPAAFRYAWPLMPLRIKGTLHGNLQHAYIPLLSVDLPSAFSFLAHGEYSQPGSTLHADLRTFDLSFVKAFLDKSTQKMLHLPALHLLADLTARGNDYGIALRAEEGRGKLSAKARVNTAKMTYAADVKANRLNIGNFLKGFGLGEFSGTLVASGKDVSNVKAKVDIQHLFYNRESLDSIHADLAKMGKEVDANIDARDHLLRGLVAVTGSLDKLNSIHLTTDLQKLDLYSLKLTDAPITVALRSSLDVSSDLKEHHALCGTISDISLQDSSQTLQANDICLDILTRRDTTTATINCGDLSLEMQAQRGYKWLMTCGERLMAAIEKNYNERTINQQDIRSKLPTMNLSLHSGEDNTLSRLLKRYDISFSRLDLRMRTSSEKGIFADLDLDGLNSAGTQLDTITMGIRSTEQPMEMFYTAEVKNSPTNSLAFEAQLDGKVLPHGIEANAQLFDNQQKKILQLGAEMAMEEEGIRLHLTPEHPVIGYEQFTLNDDNHVLLTRTGKVQANVRLNKTSSKNNTKILCTSPTDGDDSDTDLQNLTLDIQNLNLGQVLATLPYAPKVEGMLLGNFHLVQNAEKQFSVAADVAVHDLQYEGAKMGNLSSQLTYLPKEGGEQAVDATLSLNDKKMATLKGSYNTSSDALATTLQLHDLPLDLANGFVDAKLMSLKGTMKGDLRIGGSTAAPLVNGKLQLLATELTSAQYGVKLHLDDESLPITDSRLQFDHFRLYGANNKPLTIDGNVDFTHTDHIRLNMQADATDFQLMKAKETQVSDAYGTVNLNCQASIKGEPDRLQMKGKLEVLPTTNVYYILRESALQANNSMNGLITFKKEANKTTSPRGGQEVASAGREVASSSAGREGASSIDMNVIVDEGAHVKCWLNPTHNNYVDIIGNGDLRIATKDDEMRMTGRYTFSSGELRYAIPVIPLKTFSIEEGSYVEWSGEMMNPRLSVTALETIKSKVKNDNVDDMVTFKTGVKLSKTLNNMGLEFLIESPENSSVSDELALYSAEERGKLAVTLLTTGMFLSNSNTQKFNMNAVMSSFVESKVNALASSVTDFVDLSFGMQGATGNDGTLYNDYSLRVAKRFWNNRLSISVGGKVSGQKKENGKSNSFFDSAELSYRLSDVSNKYLQLFYNHSVYDNLEGNLSQYGAGFMWKKKAQMFRYLFLKQKKE